MKTQCDKVLDFMQKHAGITSYEAFVYLRVTRLAARISDLRRKGYDIFTQRERSKNQDGKAVYYDRYMLRKKGEKHDAC